LFWLNDQGKPLVVAGVPPDYFSATGQLWGNPLYNWDALRASNYHWWTARFHSAFELYDLLRIDHFRAFEAYWEIPAGSLTAIAGTWAKGPGSAPFRAAQAALGELAIIAEDLGMITDKVHQLRDELGFPGMRVLQFGFDDEHDNFHRPESYPENSVAYTGTHDNSTIVGWYQARKATEQPDILDRYLQDPVESGMPIHWQLISMVLRSPSHTAIVPLQDILGLDDSARMNVPGLADGNWRWRFSAEDLTPDISERLRIISVASDR
jgi:4-alpha-glucanotransferase